MGVRAIEAGTDQWSVSVTDLIVEKKYIMANVAKIYANELVPVFTLYSWQKYLSV